VVRIGKAFVLPVNRQFLVPTKGDKTLQQGRDGVSDTDSGTEIRAIACQKDAALRCQREGAHPGDRQRGVEAPGRAATQRGEGQKGEGKAHSHGVLGCRAKE
jgi:hypothetical protein